MGGGGGREGKIMKWTKTNKLTLILSEGGKLSHKSACVLIIITLL